MKMAVIFLLSVLLIFFFVSFIYSLQEIRILLWTETTYLDFSDNQLDNVIVTHDSDGEVRLPYTMIKISADSVDMNLKQFVAFDSLKNFVCGWFENRNIYAQRFLSDGTMLGARIRLNDQEGSAGREGIVRLALMNSGDFLAAWINTLADDGDFNMYAQIINNGDAKVDSNFQINDSDNIGKHYPVVVADNQSEIFNIFYTHHFERDSSKIFVKQYNLDAQLLGQKFKLNYQQYLMDGIFRIKYEFVCAADINVDGNIVVTWEGTHDDSPELYKIYTRSFAADFRPLMSITMVSEKSYGMKRQADVCFADSSRFLIVWSDERDRQSLRNPMSYNIYGQLFSLTGMPVGENFRINTPLLLENLRPNAEFSGSTYKISWQSWNNMIGLYETYFNSWQYYANTNGTMISSPLVYGEGGAIHHQIQWEADLPDQTFIKFQIRSAANTTNLLTAEWYGPMSTSDYYDSASGEPINPLHNGQKVIQYKVFLHGTLQGSTPLLRSVTLSYTPVDSVPPAAPTNLVATNGYSSVHLSWERPAPKDLGAYYIYRTEESGNYENAWRVKISGDLLSYMDSTVFSGKNYFYSLSALDSSQNESDLSDEVSAQPFAREIYVSADGSVGADGTLAGPLSDIQEAVDKAKYGDTVIILPGLYRTSIIMKEGISLQGSGAEQTQIDGTGNQTTIKASRNASISGLNIINNTAVNNYSIFLPKNTYNLLISENIIESSCLTISMQESKVSIINNLISSLDLGIQVSRNSEAKVKNNIIKTGLKIATFIDHSSGSMINNTIIYSSNGVETGNFSQVDIRNNIFSWQGGLDNETISLSEGSNITISHCDFWHKETWYKIFPDGGELINEGGIIHADPLFQNESKGDYRLQMNSPCIDAGNPTSSNYDTDNTRNDMGAFGGPYPIDPYLPMHMSKSVSLLPCSGFPGDTLSTYLSVQEPGGVAAANFILSFDHSLLSLSGVTTTVSTSGFDVSISKIKDGIVQINLQGGTEIENTNDQILKFDFIVNHQAVSGEASALEIQQIRLMDSAGNNYSIKTLRNGTFIVNDGNDLGRYIFVNQNYAGVEEGTSKHPFNTIKEGVAQATDGDTVLVSAGSYSENVPIEKNVYLRGTGSAVTRITPTLDRAVIHFKQVDQGEISGFTIDVSGMNNIIGPLIECESAEVHILKNRLISNGMSTVRCWINSNVVITENAFTSCCLEIENSDAIIQDNIIDSGTGNGIDCNDSSHVLISGNKISGGISGAQIAVRHSSAEIMNNWLFAGTLAEDIIGVYKSWNTLISNNLLEDFESDVIGVEITDSESIRVINNTIQTRSRGILEENSTAAIKNNIISGNLGYGIKVSSSSVLTYNDVWGNSYNYVDCSPGSGDISVDPLFIDLQQKDYRLQSISLCRDAGDPDPSYNDLDNSRNDIGLFGGPYADSAWMPVEGSHLTITSVEALKDTIILPIMADKIKGIAECEFVFSFDPALISLSGVETTDLTSGFILEKTLLANNILKISMKSAVGIVFDRGNLLTLKMVIIKPKEEKTTLEFAHALVKNELGVIKTISELDNGEIVFNIDAISHSMDKIPDTFSLTQNYPNPFNPSTTISFQLPKPAPVTLRIYNVLGQLVANIIDKKMPAGKHAIAWNAGNFSSGVYFYHLNAGNFSAVKKCLLLK